MQQALQPEPSPQPAPPAQPILGWALAQSSSFGFHSSAAGSKTTRNRNDPVIDAGEGHLMTIAPTGSGKGRSVIIPTLLSYPGPVIVIDPKGENYQVTARQRRAMGQQVFKLDPFGLTGEDSDGFNVLNTFQPEKPAAYDQAMSLASLIAPGRVLHDPFWNDSARLLLGTLILHVAAVRPPVLRNLSEVTYLLNQSTEDFNFTIKEMIKSSNEMVRYMARGFSATEPRVWASILSTAKAATGIFNGPNFAQISSFTDIPLDGIVQGDPISIYLILPPDKLDSHGLLLRMWVGCLMDQICKRRHQVQTPTLFILDEAAQLGRLEQLRRAITLLRGYGVRTWSFWQDLSQLQSLYPDWQTLYNNTRYIQTFGTTTHLLAESISNLLRLPAEIDPLTLPRDQLILAKAGRPARVLGKPDYLHDEQFQGLYDANTFYQPAAETPKVETKPEPGWRKSQREEYRQQQEVEQLADLIRGGNEPDDTPDLT